MLACCQSIVALGQETSTRARSIQCFPMISPHRVDGYLDDWGSAIPIAMKEPDAKLWIGWDAKALYVACHVRIPQGRGRIVPRFSLFLDLRSPERRNARYERGVYYIQLLIAPPKLDEDMLRERAKTGFWLAEAGSARARRVIWKEFSFTGVTRTAVIAAASVRTGQALVEARLPWATFPMPGGAVFRPVPGKRSAFAFDWGITLPGHKRAFWSGSSRNGEDPSGFARVDLLARPADFSQRQFARESLPGPPRASGVSQTPSSTGLRLSERASGFDVAKAPSPTRYTEGSPVRIEIAADCEAGYRLSPYIFGQFSEHLGMGWPMCGGLWSQALLNPSFEPGHPRLGSSLNRRYLAGRAPELLARWSPGYRGAAVARAVAAPWTIVGETKGVSTDGNAFNSKQCQKIVAKREAEVGVGQVVRLPVFREHTYHVRFFARSASAAMVTLSLRGAKSILAKSHVIVKGAEWKRYEATLRMPTTLNPKLHRYFFAATLTDGGRYGSTT